MENVDLNLKEDKGANSEDFDEEENRSFNK